MILIFESDTDVIEVSYHIYFQGTITLPPGLGPGAVLMKNEHGQLVIVHQQQLPPGSGAGATGNTPQKVCIQLYIYTSCIL